MNIFHQISRLTQYLPEVAACPLCHEKASTHGFCPACFADFDALISPPNVCPRCADTVAAGGVCGYCRQHPSDIDALWAGFDYAEPLSTLLAHWKYRGLPQYSRALQSLMLRHPPRFAEPIGFDWVIPVPMSRKRLFARGFHHSLVLAKAAADYYSVRLCPNGSVVREHRIAQTKLDRKARLHNLKDSFSVKLDVNNCNLLLIDDVVTTGATLHELAHSLKKQGAHRIYAWVLAHKQMQKI